MMNLEEFVREYATTIQQQAQAKPGEYKLPMDFSRSAALMANALRKGDFNPDAPALKVMLKKYGVTKYSKKAAIEWFAANVESTAPEDLMLAGGTVDTTGMVSSEELAEYLQPSNGPPGRLYRKITFITPETNLDDYVGKTVYARTAMNAYFGLLVIGYKDGYVQLEGAYDIYGETNLTLRVPRAQALAIVDHAPRTPTSQDYQELASRG